MRFLAAALVSAFLCLSAEGGINYADPVPGDGCGSVDPNKPCYSFTMGAKFDSCKALGAYLQECYECGRNRFGRQICVAVDHSASCQCKQDEKDDVSGQIVPCSTYGTCTFSEF
ncbi:MAG TPA: hypothetical protein VEK57_17925 [Thermoanaerobaculia bacterium]|nr:hypothetical protein [Thermoanaerobaculia bacterium]